MKPHWLISTIGLLLFIQCNKHKDLAPLGPGIFLSCDLPPHKWYPIKAFLKENNIKITFYIESFQTLTLSEKNIAKEMMADGHEMAHHTSTHPNLDTYLESHTIEEYMNNEIIPMKNQMKAEGYGCITFAYPHGASTKDCDIVLLEHFWSVRKLYNTYLLKKLEDIPAIYYRYGENEILVAASIDKKNNHSLTEILNALEKAAKSKQTISLYCHEIAFNGKDEGEYSIEESDLKAIINKAVQLNFKSYTAAQISKSK